MKRIIQLILFLFLIIIAIIFYNTYFNTNEKPKTDLGTNQDQLQLKNENNLIKNLKYEIRLDDNNQYIITSDLSEISYDGNFEIVKMQQVTAIYLDQNNIPLTILSDEAIYNNTSYNTNFIHNVRIEYLDNIILSDRLDLDFNTNTILIHENVQYEGSRGVITSDNVKIDLITKKIEIYMNNNLDKVKITTNQ
jgi:hypothetical protein